MQSVLDSETLGAGDFILLRSGRKLTPHPFFLVLDHAIGVARWRLVQEAIDHLRVEVAMPGGHTDGDLDGIRRSVGALVDAGTTIEVVVVDALLDDRATKLRSVSSKLPEGQTPR